MKLYIHSSSEWAADWSARRNSETGEDYYVLSLPIGTARVFHHLDTGLYNAQVKFRDGNNRSSIAMEDLTSCMNWAEGILFVR